MKDYLALAVCIVGGLIWLVCAATGKYPDWKDFGKVTYFAGLLAVLLK